MEVNPAGQVVRTWTFPVGWYVYRIAAITNPTPIVTPTPSISPSTSSVPINSQTIITGVGLTAVIVVVVVLAVVFYMRKRASNHKIDDNKETPEF